MINAIFEEIERNDFSENPTLMLDLERIRQDEEGYFFSTKVVEPILRVEYDGVKSVSIEICYSYNEISSHLDMIELILEKARSFILPCVLDQEFRVEIRLEKSLAICISATSVDEIRYKNAMEAVVNELFVLMALY